MLRELLAFLTAEQVAPTAGGLKQIELLGAQAVGGFVRRTLSRLSEPARELARAAAVLGSGADLRQAGALAGLDRRTAASAVDRLVAAEVLSAGQPLEFAHPLIEAGVHGSIPPGQVSEN